MLILKGSLIQRSKLKDSSVKAAIAERFNLMDVVPEFGVLVCPKISL